MTKKHFIAYVLPLMGLRQATSYNDVGAVSIDYAPYYGGYQLEQIVSATGGVKPLLPRRMTSRELIVFLSGVQFALERQVQP